MAFLGFRYYNTPVLRPLAPFIAGGAVTFYLVNLAQKQMLQAPVYRDDPRNPYASGKKAAAH